MPVPTKDEVFMTMIEHLRMAQENSATLAHLARANNSNALSDGWLCVSELLKRMVYQVTKLATKGRLN